MANTVNLNLNGDAIERAGKAAAAEAVASAAEHVLNVSNERVPIETGVLQNSGNTFVDEQRLQAAIYYDTPYAVAQHENMHYRHDSGRQAKYLESALIDESDTVAKIMQQALAKALEG